MFPNLDSDMIRFVSGTIAFVVLAVWNIVIAEQVAVEALPVSVERSEQGAIVRVGDELFVEYLTHSGHQPVI